MAYLLDQIQEYNVEHFQNTKIRRRRGFLNIVGEIAKDRFGTLSDTDAKDYLQKFEDLQKQNVFRDEIDKQQSTLIQSTFNLLIEPREQAIKEVRQYISQIQETLTTYSIQMNQYTYTYALHREKQHKYYARWYSRSVFIHHTTRRFCRLNS